ncbi:hypothetical protein UIB01_00720 [Stutzerimonas decontaminans]|uniref:Uncharacterized protein n=1 Tax=Stutzerimonas stutzeri TaxID=316 RepID=A0A023WN12_STUST|nr:hypothetical protein UIB01_00720 [Stutzerimonas decontaminans]
MQLVKNPRGTVCLRSPRRGHALTYQCRWQYSLRHTHTTACCRSPSQKLHPSGVVNWLAGYRRW